MRLNLLKSVSRPTRKASRRSSTRTKSSVKRRSRTLTKLGKRRVFHITHKQGEWTIKEEKSTRKFGTFSTKKDALAKGKKLAKSSGLGELIVHRKDHRIQTEYTYGKDPRKYRG